MSYERDSKQDPYTLDMVNSLINLDDPPFIVTARREHDIVHHFVGDVWLGSHLPNIRDEELDEANWTALAKPMTSAEPTRMHWRCSFCDTVNERAVETCKCGKAHGCCPIDGAYICEHGSSHDEWVD